MKEILLIALRAVLGGTLVVVFSVLGEMLRPKSFAGVFAAAPSIAIASLVVLGIVDGSTALVMAATGMIVGAIAFSVAMVVGVDSVKHFRARAGSVAALAVWLLVAAGLYAVALR